MKALDTNILARFFIDDPDDPEAAKQRPAAIVALSERAFVSVTVLLEFEWVMRGFYELPSRQVVKMFRALAGIEHIFSIEDRAALPSALDGVERGLDFADALHLARSQRAAGFVTTDRRLARRARDLNLEPAVELLS